jgi:tetratricopeptide (TPR) repeat protein
VPLAREALNRGGMSGEARSVLGHALLELGNIDAAFEELTEAFRLDPASDELPATLARLAIRMGRAEEALQFAEVAQWKNPASLDTAVALVKTRIALHDYDRAEADLEPLVARYPASHDLYAQLGALHLARGARAPARAAFARALELYADCRDAVVGMVSLDLAEGHLAAALARATGAATSRPNDPDFLLLAAPVYEAAGDTTRAESAWRRVLEIDAANERAVLELSDFLVRRRRYPESQRALERLLERRPQSIPVQTSLGLVLERMGRPADARTRYEKIVAQSSRAPKAAGRLAALLTDGNGNLDYALGLARSARQQLPDDPDVADVLGWIYTRKNMPSLGLPHLQQAVRRAPDNPRFAFHLASARLQSRQFDEARAEFTRALQLDPNFAEAQQARSALASLRQ